MKNCVPFSAAALAGGAAALILRLLQNRTGFDTAGLPIPGNVPGLALVGCLILMAVVLWVLSRRLSAPAGSSFPGSFSAENPTALFFPVAGILLIALSGLADLYEALTLNNLIVLLQAAADPYSALPETAASAGFSSASQLILGATALLSAAALFLAVLACRKQRTDTLPALALLIPPVALVVRLVMTYRLDSINPALEAYFVELLALIFLTLSFYRLASFAFGDGRLSRFALYAGLASVCSMAALADGGPHLSSLLLYSGGTLSVLGFLLLFAPSGDTLSDAPASDSSCSE